jgi:hypothetical protein
MTKRFLLEVDDVSEYVSHFDITNNGKVCFFGKNNIQDINSKTQYFFIDGITGTVKYLTDVPVTFCVSRNGKFMLYYKRIKNNPATYFSGALYDLTNNSTLKYFTWSVIDTDYGIPNFDIICEDESNFKILCVFEGGYIGATAILDTNKLDIKTLWDRTNEDNVTKFPRTIDKEYSSERIQDNPEFNISLVPNKYTDIDSETYQSMYQNMSNFQSTHTTLDNLRLRDSPTTSGAIITTLQKNTDVQLLETGTEATIDGITAPWVKVLSSNGYEGWCFSGFLKAVNVKKEKQDDDPDLTNEIEIDNQDSTQDSKTTFSLLWVLIGAGVIVIAGIVFFVIKKRNK